MQMSGETKRRLKRILITNKCRKCAITRDVRNCFNYRAGLRLKTIRIRIVVFKQQQIQDAE